MAWPAPSPGTSLETEGDLRPREMTVHDRIRLTGLLGLLFLLIHPGRGAARIYQ